MLEIKTLTGNTPRRFDEAVNAALTEGWELVRRECFITGSDRATTFYAELERAIEEPEYEEVDGDEVAEWQMSRDTHYPYKCSACGCNCHKPIDYCPHCGREMVNAEK